MSNEKEGIKMSLEIDWKKLRKHVNKINEEAKKAINTILQEYQPTKEENYVFEGTPRQIGNIADTLFKIASYFAITVVHQELVSPAYKLALDAMIKGNESFSEAFVAMEMALKNAVDSGILRKYDIEGPPFLG